MGKPDFVVIRHINDVYLIPKNNLGDALVRGQGDNDDIIDRTYSSPFLDGLAFAGGYGSQTQINDGSSGANNTSSQPS